MKGDSVFITASPEDIAEIAKLDKFSFAGATLSISALDPPSPQRTSRDEGKHGVSQAATETKEKFKAILAGRYDGNIKLLNLSALAQDPGLVEMGLGAFDGKVTSKLFPAMMVVCDQMFSTWQEKRDAIVSVSLASNGLDNVRHVTALASTFPNLKNLDLSANSLSNLKSIESWRWKFRHLENLVLTDNPITTEPNFNVELMKWYPKLQQLNGIQVRTPEQIAATMEAANSPIPISGPDFRDVSQVGENFVRQFFGSYDNDRAALLSNYYDAQSLFSIAINMTAPRDREHPTAIPPWGQYTKHSRNLKKYTTPNARFNRRYKGIQAIQITWSDFPATRHPDINTQTDKYIIECHPVPGLPDPSGQTPHGVDGLTLTIHGEFEEQNPSVSDKALRSFSRTFVLGPGGPGSPQIRVISDMLCLRAYAPLAIPAAARPPTPLLQMAQPAPLQLAQAAHVELTPEQQKEAIAQQLMEKTGMTTEYAVMCLVETGWNIEAAYGAFMANKVSPHTSPIQPDKCLTTTQDKLPPNAFVASAAQIAGAPR
jgi:nuclear RNA export factor